MSCPYTSSQNGKAERMIRTTNDTIRTLLQAHLPTRFWAEGLHTSTYLLNRLPSTTCPAPTPHQALFGTPPRYDHLRVFGCACYPNTAATGPHKLAPRSTLCVFLGYSPDHKGYRCFDLSSRRVLISRHVVFDESVFPYSSTTTPPSSNPDLDLFTLFPTNAVVEPPILPLSAGTRSPPDGPTPDPVPCPGPVVSPLCGPRLRSPRLRGRRYRPLRPSSPSRCGSTSASPCCPCRRPRDRHRRSLRHASPSRCASTSAGCRHRVSPPPPSSPPVTSPPAAPPVAQSRQGHLHLRRGHPRHVSRRRCTTHRSFTATRGTSTR
jgi:hypothetical protein